MFNFIIKIMSRWLVKDYGVSSMSEFKFTLKRERDRADRSNSTFSLVAFDIAGLSKYEIGQCIELSKKRIRISDEIGWFDEKRIALMLPDTTVNGAQILSTSIIEALMGSGISLHSNIYSYPSTNWIDRPEKMDADINETLTKSIATGYSTPVWKRAMDIMGSVIGIIILSPLLIFVSVLIKVVSPGPVFFTQERIGKTGRIFTFLKFRTMHANNDTSAHQEYLKDLINAADSGDKPMEKIENDPRIIPLGSFIRKSCIDELPQLINVLRGDMSLVGPRPCIPYEAEEYLRWHSRRFDTTPGMTGLWQVSGKNTLTFREMIRLDIQYAEQRSIALDSYILFKTPLFILSEVLDVINKKRAHSKKQHTRSSEAVLINTQ